MKNSRRKLNNKLRPYQLFALLVDGWVRDHDPNPQRALNWAELVNHHNINCPWKKAKALVQASKCPTMEDAKALVMDLYLYRKSQNERNDTTGIALDVSDKEAARMFREFISRIHKANGKPYQSKINFDNI